VYIYLGNFNGVSTWNWYITPFGPYGTGGDGASHNYPIAYMISKGGNKVFVLFKNHIYLPSSTMAADFSNAGFAGSWVEIGKPGMGMTLGTMSGDGSHLFVSYNNSIWRSTDDGNSWFPPNTFPIGIGENVQSVVTSDDGSSVAVYTLDGSSKGYVYVSTDGGQNFVQSSTAGYKAWGGITLEPH
jgi:hypothetical protein